MQWIWRNRWAVLALAGGLALRLWFVHALPHVEGDSLVYGDLAKNMLRHHVYGLTEGAVIRPTLIRLPGYPALVATCFGMFHVEHYGAVMYVQLAMDLLTCVVVGALAGRWGGERAGVAAVVLAAVCPFTANYVAAPLTEAPAVLCCAVALYALERWRVTGAAGWAVGVGAAVSFAFLLRPDRALLAVAVVGAMAWMAWRARKMAHVVLVCALVLAPLAGWGLRNWKVFHIVQPLAPKSATDPGERVNYGFQRWYRTWAMDFASTADVYWNWDGSQISMGDLPSRAFDSARQRAQTAALLARYNVTTAASPAVDAEFGQIAAERVKAHPVRYYVALPVVRLLNMWLRPRDEMFLRALDWWNVSAHVRSSVESMAYAALNLVYLALAFVGLWRWRRVVDQAQWPVVWAAVAYVALRCVLLLTLDNSEPRYTIDCFPVVFLLAGLAFARASERRSSSCP